MYYLVLLISNYYRWLSQWGVKLASEKAMRQTARQWTIDSIGVEMMPFTFPVQEGQEVRSAPCVYALDLTACVMTHLEELFQ